VTINEGADPAVAQDLESALEKVVDDGWDWKHVEDPDGPNAPSHIRASLMSPQILVPLDDGKLALGTWQGIFFCEFDGPRDRKWFEDHLPEDGSAVLDDVTSAWCTLGLWGPSATVTGRQQFVLDALYAAAANAIKEAVETARHSGVRVMAAITEPKSSGLFQADKDKKEKK
jgi:hypothetical protein